MSYTFDNNGTHCDTDIGGDGRVSNPKFGIGALKFGMGEFTKQLIVDKEYEIYKNCWWDICFE